jgi:lipid II:glycine glycyltransferase (peptidoglycan interpeptide bridge formation enzyme)
VVGRTRDALQVEAETAVQLGLREVDGHFVQHWDTFAVEGPGGDIYQSIAWADHWAKWGWRPQFLLFDDGFPLLCLKRPWPHLAGSTAQLPRGPISGGESADRTAARLVAAHNYLVSRGADVVSSDAGIPVVTGYRDLIERVGFRPIEEVEPSRHRVALSLGPKEEDLFRGIARSTRQRVHAAERRGVRVIRYDARPMIGSWDGFERGPVWPLNAGDLRPIMDRFYDLLQHASRRRRFILAPRERVLDWTCSAVSRGHAVYLEVKDPNGGLLGAGLFYRHGGRLTFAHSADLDDRRHDQPGAMHLMLWRAIQLAKRDGLTEFDLAGVDVLGHREIPRPGDPMYGLYAFKTSFGGQWVEMSGNHSRVAHRGRYFAGRIERHLAGITARAVSRFRRWA